MTTVLMTHGAFIHAMNETGAFGTAAMQTFRSMLEANHTSEQLLDAMRDTLNASDLPLALTDHQYKILQGWLLDARLAKTRVYYLQQQQ